MSACTVCHTPIGAITLEENDGYITGLSFGHTRPLSAGKSASPLLQTAVAQLLEYFSGTRRTFTLPCRPAGTAFQRAVWQALGAIPYGQTRTYKDIAASVGNPKAYRAVGLACRNNPLVIVVPCHRVLGANGSLTGFAGGLTMKQQLLELEQRALAHSAPSPATDASRCPGTATVRPGIAPH